MGARRGESNRAAALRRRYGLSPAEWEEMLAKQGRRCAICGAAEPGGNKRQWHVDHDHASGRVRGLLCSFCNRRLLPLVEHRVELVNSALRYLGSAV